jgi:hypothetical protein
MKIKDIRLEEKISAKLLILPLHAWIRIQAKRKKNTGIITTMES